MTVTFADKLARIPHYEPGTSLDDAAARAETPDAIKLASNESPFPPHPAVIAAIAAAAGDLNRYPDPAATVLRGRITKRTRQSPAGSRSGQPGACRSRSCVNRCRGYRPRPTTPRLPHPHRPHPARA